MKVPFTKETAAEMQRRSQVSIAARKVETAARLAELDASANDDDMVLRTRKQLVKLDVLIDAALDTGKVARFMSLARLKKDLWDMVLPKAGVMRPRATGKRSQAPQVGPAGE